jgi:hypothetical protein
MNAKTKQNKTVQAMNCCSLCSPELRRDAGERGEKLMYEVAGIGVVRDMK